MDPVWQRWCTPLSTLNMCTHVQYTFHRHEGQLRLCKARSFSVLLSTNSMCLKHCWICFVLGSIVLSFIWIFHSFFPLSLFSGRLVDIRGVCSFSHWPLQHTDDGGFLSCGHELDTVTSFHLCLKECGTCGLPFEFSLFLPTNIFD